MRFTAFIFPLLACGAAGYFAYHLQTGDHGLEARAELDGRKEVLEGELAGLKEVRDRLERDVALLRPESLDPDMLDERARAILNLAHHDDLIMMKRRQPVPETPASSPRRRSPDPEDDSKLPGDFRLVLAFGANPRTAIEEPIAVTPPSLSPGAANLWLGDGKAGAANLPGRPSLTPEQELSAYRLMLLIRRFEEKAGQLYGMGYIGGFCHLYIGQEAVVAGMQMTISDGDQVITAYRDHGHMLAAGMEPKRVMAELTGRRHGYAKGKGGSMHMFSVGARTSMAATASSARRRRSAPALPSPTNIAATIASASPISARAPPIRARSMRASTWRRCGSFP